MVLVYSSFTNNSPHIIRELTKAVSKNVIIIPFRIEDAPLSKSMEYLISIPHWLDAMTPPLEVHINKLAQDIQNILAREKNERK
jgi:protein involved in ribonucleotide reduction